jgi:hypothetical protein
MKTLCIKLNNCATNDPCAICGTRCDPDTGPELFLDGTWALVCDECAEREAPELFYLLELYRAAGLAVHVLNRDTTIPLEQVVERKF